MKSLKYLGILAIACVINFSFNSCGDDGPTIAKPTINLTEVGHDNGHHAHPGHDMHLEANIQAPGTIHDIVVEIEQVGGTTKIKEMYTKGKYVGVRTPSFMSTSTSRPAHHWASTCFTSLSPTTWGSKRPFHVKSTWKRVATSPTAMMRRTKMSHLAL